MSENEHNSDKTKWAAALSQHCAWLLWINSCATGNQGDTAESLVGSNKRANLSLLAQVKCDSQLQRVQRSTTFPSPLLSLESSRVVKMTLLDVRRDQDSLLRYVGSKVPPCDFQGRLVNFSCPRLNREYRFHLDKGQV